MGDVTEKDTEVAAQKPLERAGQHSVFLSDGDALGGGEPFGQIGNDRDLLLFQGVLGHDTLHGSSGHTEVLGQPYGTLDNVNQRLHGETQRVALVRAG